MFCMKERKSVCRKTFIIIRAHRKITMNYIITHTFDCGVLFEIKTHIIRSFENDTSANDWAFSRPQSLRLFPNSLLLLAEYDEVYSLSENEWEFYCLNDKRCRALLPFISGADILKMGAEEKKKSIDKKSLYYSDRDYMEINCSISVVYRAVSSIYGDRKMFNFSVLSYGIERL